MVQQLDELGEGANPEGRGRDQMKVEIVHLSIVASAHSKDMTADVTFECDTEGALWLQSQMGKNLAPQKMSMAAASGAVRATERAVADMPMPMAARKERTTSARDNLLNILDEEGVLKK